MANNECVHQESQFAAKGNGCVNTREGELSSPVLYTTCYSRTQINATCSGVEAGCPTQGVRLYARQMYDLFVGIPGTRKPSHLIL